MHVSASGGDDAGGGGLTGIGKIRKGGRSEVDEQTGIQTNQRVMDPSKRKNRKGRHDTSRRQGQERNPSV